MQIVKTTVKARRRRLKGTWTLEKPRVTSHTDPVYTYDGRWFFADESYDEHGPYRTEAEARLSLARYIVYLETGEVVAFADDH